MKTKSTIRIRCITGVVLLIASVLIVRLYQVQVYRHSGYLERAERQYVHTVEDLFSRGSIYFKAKTGERVSAATIQSGYVLAVNPTQITDPGRIYDAIEGLIDVDRDTFIDRAAREDRTYVEIDRTISRSDAENIREFNFPGVHLYRNQWRYYPANDLAARTVGFVGYGDDRLMGQYGLERYYEDVLSRENEHLSVNFFAEIFSNLGDLVFERTEAPQSGDLITSLEPTVARTLDRALLEVQDRWQSRLSGGIIMDPKTGDVQALGVVPSFNLNDRTGVAISDFRNPLIEDVYEMGSIIKSLTMAAGVDSGAVERYSTYYDAGKIELDTAVIGNFDGKGRGYVDMQEVLNQSLNTGAAYIVGKMGKENFRDYFLNLKLGSETGIDLPGETYGLISNLDSPRDIEYATASYGQGIALTPIATVRALATLANGGVLKTPHIVQEIQYENGMVHEVDYPDGAQVFSKETTDMITTMLVEVVDSALRNGTVAKEHYSIAAKTGTAQMADTENGGYYNDRYLHSFFGYFPAYNPEYLIFLYTVEPKGVRYASQTLTKPFMDIVDFLINYYDIPPDR